MISKKNERDILKQSIDTVLQDTDITMVSSGSVAKAMCGAVARPLADIYQVLDDTRRSGFIATASGFYLDLFGNAVGLPRKLATPVIVDPEDENVKLYVRSGRLAPSFPHPTNLNLGRIPQGTTLTNTSGSVTYATTTDFDFPASATEVFVGVTSSLTGTSQNVGAGELRNLTPAVSGILATNLSDIISGNDVEDDQEYRFRLSKWLTSVSGSNESAIRLAVLSVPGIADVIQQEYYAGAGTFRIVLIPVGNRVPTGSLRAARSAVESAKAFGISASVEEPRYLPFSISISLLRANGARGLSSLARDRAEQAVRSYVGNIRPGGTLVINQLRNAILNSSSEISDLVISSLEVNRRPRLLTNLTLKNDELLVPDSSMTTPILII